MEKVYLIKENMRSKIPAVTHVDGTGRLQTVDKEFEPKYHGLVSNLKRWLLWYNLHIPVYSILRIHLSACNNVPVET